MISIDQIFRDNLIIVNLTANILSMKINSGLGFLRSVKFHA